MRTPSNPIPDFDARVEAAAQRYFEMRADVFGTVPTWEHCLSVGATMVAMQMEENIKQNTLKAIEEIQARQAARKAAINGK